MALPTANGRHRNFYIALAAGAAVSVLTLLFAPTMFPAAAASIFSLTYLILSLRDLPKLDPGYLRQHAGDEDAPPWVIFALTLGIVIYVTIALFLAVNDSSPDPVRLSLGVLSVVFVWLTIHTMWGMHYAWEFYEAPDDRSRGEQQGGLDFPGGRDPCGSDFVYFSMVIAMTAQTSDTNVTSPQMRRIITVHSLFSYLFTTVVIAASINIVLSLGHAS